MNNQFILGTSTSSGKHTIASLIAYSLRGRGYSVCPFKPISIDINTNCERMCESIYYQCAISGAIPIPEMNPIRFKYSSIDSTMNLFADSHQFELNENGKYIQQEHVNKNLEYSISLLRKKYDVIVGEGSGNVTDALSFDMAQYKSIRFLDADVSIVCSDENGGVYASVVGLIELLPDDIKSRVIAIYINKMNPPLSVPLLDEFRLLLDSKYGISKVITLPKFQSLKYNKEDIPYDPKIESDLLREIRFLSETTELASPQYVSLLC